jgi:hypothetical protein
MFLRHGITLACNRFDQRRLAAPVRPENRDMFIASNPEAEVIERDFLPPHYADVLEIQQWRRFRSHRLQV